MASTLSDFSGLNRKIRTSVLIDFGTGAGLVDYTSNLGHYSVLIQPRQDVYGLFDITLDAVLFVANATPNWSNNGLKVQASIGVTSDNGTTYFDATVFTGTSTRNKTIPVNEIKLRATSLNSNYLTNPTGYAKTFVGYDIHDILREILRFVGVTDSQIDLPLFGLNLQLYVAPADITLETIINELAALTLSHYGFDIDGKFRAHSVVREFTTPTEVWGLSTTAEFKQRQVDDSYYNKITISGKEISPVYFNPTGLMYSKNNFSGAFVEAGATVSFSIPIDGYYLSSATAFNGADGIWKVTLRTADDNVSSVYTQVDFLNESLTTDAGAQSLTLTIRNRGSNRAYLRVVIINGTGVKLLGDIVQGYTNAPALIADGEVYELTIQSNAISTIAYATILLNQLQRHFSDPLSVYALDVQGRPDANMALPAQITDRNNTIVNGYLQYIDTEMSQDKGFVQSIVIKKAPAPISYLICDDPSATPTLCNVDYCFY